MLELVPLPLEGDLLETLHLALKKNKHPPLSFHTWPRRNDLPLNLYLGRVRGPLRIFPPSDLLGTSPPTSHIYLQFVSSWGARALLLGAPSTGPLLHNKPRAGIELSPAYPFCTTFNPTIRR
jgi:hypothetical protein